MQREMILIINCLRENQRLLLNEQMFTGGQNINEKLKCEPSMRQQSSLSTHLKIHSN